MPVQPQLVQPIHAHRNIVPTTARVTTEITPYGAPHKRHLDDCWTLDPVYEDDVNTPIGWDPYRLYNGYRKPNARQVSLEIMSTHSITENNKFTDLVMVWGQFLDHSARNPASASRRIVSLCLPRRTIPD